MPTEDATHPLASLPSFADGFAVVEVEAALVVSEERFSTNLPYANSSTFVANILFARSPRSFDELSCSVATSVPSVDGFAPFEDTEADGDKGEDAAAAADVATATATSERDFEACASSCGEGLRAEGVAWFGDESRGDNTSEGGGVAPVVGADFCDMMTEMVDADADEVEILALDEEEDAGVAVVLPDFSFEADFLLSNA